MDKNTSLASFDLSELTHLPDAYTNDYGLAKLDGFSSPTSIDKLQISDNDSLVNMDGLSGLTTIGGDLIMTTNPILTNFSGLDNITRIDGSLRISLNDSLENVDADCENPKKYCLLQWTA